MSNKSNAEEQAQNKSDELQGILAMLTLIHQWQCERDKLIHRQINNLLMDLARIKVRSRLNRFDLVDTKTKNTPCTKLNTTARGR